ncbi:hypothetical protein JAAARDRAFT_141372 [Jaapia argillacea MUCL 33604]|uniref:Alpha-type protein kinase domain-containing protein n=1 Tax=Jaapia argillacea MUCL 33604 TaxID=933084 RepID=A0A067P7R5_9AGAM|nr:hypothetical protein JAAARDRAFT_141372 [Jaapia argillacea MUCL 33604]
MEAGIHGDLSYQLTHIGKDTFKIAHAGHLTLSSWVAPKLLGSKPGEPVAVKRPYFSKKEKTIEQICRFPANEEVLRVWKEANILLWSISLLSFTYAFIDRAIRKSPHPPPFNIPSLRFVNAGIAVVHTGHGSLHAGYLVEEMIDSDDHGSFIKYIHNGTAVPALDPSDELYGLAQFLCFTQHVQYAKTGGSVYISDYQGAPSHPHKFIQFI